MKVALITRSTLYTVRGGDTTQVEETARQLRLLGIDADIVLTSEKNRLDGYDLHHFFNITRPADILRHIWNSRIPFVLSPIWIDYAAYDKYHRSGLLGKTFQVLSPQRIEYAKTIARWLKGKDIHPGWSYLQKGQDKSIRDILAKASMLLTNSEEEYLEIKKHYPRLPPYSNVTIGINEELFRPGDITKENDLVICVGRIEGIKNQLNLIKALNHTGYRLVLICNAAPNQPGYYQACRQIAADNISFVSHVPQKELLFYYQKAKVHVLPSWYESCGLASLEAAAMGCNIVITRNGFASSYFDNDAFYCQPSSPKSILEAVQAAAVSIQPRGLQEKVTTEFTWKKAANQTLQAYQKVLSRE